MNMPNYQTKLRKILRKAKQPHIGWLDVFPAVIGKADGTVLTGTPGEIYVRNILNGQTLTVHNTIAPNRFRLQVEVGRRVDLLSLWQVKSVLEPFDQPAGGGYIQYHKEQHIFPASDAPFFPRKQTREFTVLVADSENFIVQVFGGQFRSLTGNKLIEHEQIDLSSYIPDAGAIYVNIETDTEGVLSVHEGTAFGAPAVATAGDIPVPETGYRRVATILLFESMEALLDEHILIPMPLEADSGGLGAVWGSITGTLADQTDLQSELDLRFRFFMSESNPGPDDDETLGYKVGDWWMQTTETKFFQAFGVAEGAAGWVRLLNDLAVEYFNGTLGAIEDEDLIGFYNVSDDNFRLINGTNFKAWLKTYFDTLYATPAYVDTAEADAKAYADSLVVGLWDDRGSFDASGGAYPSSGGSGTAGAILKGDAWTISVAGTLPTGQVVEVGDLVRALINTPGNTQANWAITQNNIGYTAENSANKSTDVNADQASNVKYPSVKAVFDWVVALFAPIAKGVTNGDSHDHAGGDGAQIAHTGLSSIGTNTHVQIDTHIANAAIHGTPIAETQTADIFSCSSPGGASAWTGTINGAPSGASVTLTTSTGSEGALKPTATNQLGKMRLYNLTRGNSALISDYNTTTNVCTLTANAPGTWANGDSMTIASQTVTGAFGTMVDIEITSGPTGKSYMFLTHVCLSATAGDRFTLHPTETFSASKYKNNFAQAANIANETDPLIKINSNLFSLGWTGTPTTVIVREAGYLS